MATNIEHAVLPENLSHVSQHVDAESGYTVHIIGTAHVSKESTKQVVDLIQHVQPGIVMIELCNSRKAILLAPEEELEKQSQQSLWELIVSSYSQKVSLRTMLLRVLISYFTKTISNQLGVIPGYEFRAAYKAAKEANATVVLGDRPVDITLQRTWSALSVYEKVKLLIHIIRESREQISAQDIEELKKSDALEEVLKLFGVEFPQMRDILITERDMYMADKVLHCITKLKHANARMKHIYDNLVQQQQLRMVKKQTNEDNTDVEQIASNDEPSADVQQDENENTTTEIPPFEENKHICVVVGAGHVPGILSYLAAPHTIKKMDSLMKQPDSQFFRTFLFMLALVTVFLSIVFKFVNWISN